MSKKLTKKQLKKSKGGLTPRDLDRGVEPLLESNDSNRSIAKKKKK